MRRRLKSESKSKLLAQDLIHVGYWRDFPNMASFPKVASHRPCHGICRHTGTRCDALCGRLLAPPRSRLHAKLIDTTHSARDQLVLNRNPVSLKQLETHNNGIGRRTRIRATTSDYQECMYVSLARQQMVHSCFASDADDTIKILLATDNHIGYLERDPVRGQDSINTFREVLQLAVKHDVRLYDAELLSLSSPITVLPCFPYSGRFCAPWRRSLPRQQAVSRLPIPSYGPPSRIHPRRQANTD